MVYHDLHRIQSLSVPINQGLFYIELYANWIESGFTNINQILTEQLKK